MNIFQAISAALQAFVTFFGTVNKTALALDAVADVALNASKHFRDKEILRNATDIQRVQKELAVLLEQPVVLPAPKGTTE